VKHRRLELHLIRELGDQQPKKDPNYRSFISSIELVSDIRLIGRENDLQAKFPFNKVKSGDGQSLLLVLVDIS